MKRFITLILIISIAMLGVSCDSKATVDEVAKWNFRLAGLTADLGAAINKAKGEGRVTPEKAAQAAVLLQGVVSGGKATTTFLRELAAKYPNGDIPSDELKKLFLNFSDIVVKPVRELLVALEVLSGEDGDYLMLALSALRSFISEISRKLKRSGVQGAYLYNTLSGKELYNG